MWKLSERREERTTTDDWIGNFLLDFKDNRITFGLDEDSENWAVRLEGGILATGPTIEQAVWNARTELAKRKLDLLIDSPMATAKEISSAMKTAMEYLNHEDGYSVAVRASEAIIQRVKK